MTPPQVAKDHDLLKYARLQHKIVKAAWNASTFMWDVTVERADGTQFVDSANVFINGTGVLCVVRAGIHRAAHSLQERLEVARHPEPHLVPRRTSP